VSPLVAPVSVTPARDPNFSLVSSPGPTAIDLFPSGIYNITSVPTDITPPPYEYDQSNPDPAFDRDNPILLQKAYVHKIPISESTVTPNFKSNEIPIVNSSDNEFLVSIDGDRISTAAAATAKPQSIYNQGVCREIPILESTVPPISESTVIPISNSTSGLPHLQSNSNSISPIDITPPPYEYDQSNPDPAFDRDNPILLQKAYVHELPVVNSSENELLVSTDGDRITTAAAATAKLQSIYNQGVCREIPILESTVPPILNSVLPHFKSTNPGQQQIIPHAASNIHGDYIQAATTDILASTERVDPVDAVLPILKSNWRATRNKLRGAFIVSIKGALYPNRRAARNTLRGAFLVSIDGDRIFTAAAATAKLQSIYNQGVCREIPIVFAPKQKLTTTAARKVDNEYGLFAPTTNWDESEAIYDNDIPFLDRTATIPTVQATKLQCNQDIKELYDTATLHVNDITLAPYEYDESNPDPSFDRDNPILLQKAYVDDTNDLKCTHNLQSPAIPYLLSTSFLLFSSLKIKGCTTLSLQQVIAYLRDLLGSDCVCPRNITLPSFNLRYWLLARN